MKLRNLQRVALYFLFFSINFEVWDPLGTHGSFSLSKLAGYFYFFTIITELPSFFRTSSIKKFLTPLLAFFILLSIVNFININATSSVFIDVSIFQNIILFIILINHERKFPGTLEKGLFYFALGSFLLALLFQLGIGVNYDHGRVTIFGDNQNIIAIKECTSIIILLAFLRNRNPVFKKKQYFVLLFIPLMFSLMIQTGSRSAFITFCLMIFSGVLLMKGPKRYSKIFIFFLGVILGFVIWYYLPTSGVLYSRLKLTEQSHDLGGRAGIWEIVLPFIKNNPLFGRGESGYISYITRSTGNYISPHNVILEVLSYTGIVGLSLYILFLSRIFLISLKKYRKDGSLLRLLLIIPILSQLLSGQLLNVKLGYVIFAFSVSGTFYLRSLNAKIRKTATIRKLHSQV